MPKNERANKNRKGNKRIMEGRKRGKNPFLELNIEKRLFILFLLCFIITLIAQIVLNNPSIRAEITHEAKLEGLPMQKEEFLYSIGELTLKLTDKNGFVNNMDGNDIGENVKVLINGEEKYNFSEREITISVKNGDVIEIDATEIKDYIDVMIVSKSDNITNNCEGQKYRIQSEVKKIVKVNVK